MKIFTDYDGRPVRLTPEREAHILDHPEMPGLLDRVREAVSKPECTVLSTSDPTVELLYSSERGTKVGDKWLCVVVKYYAVDEFVVTAYLAYKLKKREHLWPRK